MNLKEIRNRQGLSIRKLSDLASVPVRTIEDIERFNRCKVDTAIKLADALQVTLDELCRDRVAKYRSPCFFIRHKPPSELFPYYNHFKCRNVPPGTNSNTKPSVGCGIRMKYHVLPLLSFVIGHTITN